VIAGTFGRRATAVIGLLIAACSLPAPAAAHKHTHAAVPESSTAGPAATQPAAAPSTGAGIVAAESLRAGRGRPAAARPYPMPSMRQAIFEHLHNKLVHVPLTLAVVAALLLVVGRRRSEMEASGRWLVWLAALGGAGAYVTGRVQKEEFKGEPKEWLAGLHERWGTAAAIALLVWALLTLWKPTRRYAWLWGLVAAALAVITGFYGGVLAHGE